MKRFLDKYADHLGITGSFLCLIHCLAAPMLALFTTGLAHSGHYHFHFFPGDDYFFIALSVFAVYFASRNVRNRKVLISLWVSMSVFAISLSIARYNHDWEWMEYFAHLGAVGLIVSHLINIREIRRHAACAHPEHQMAAVGKK
jgi:hypothetical protein